MTIDMTDLVEMNTIIWTDQKGRRTPITQLEDRHLFNILKWLDKQQTRYEESLDAAYGASALFTGEMALYEVDNAIAHIEETLLSIAYWKNIMENEINRRIEITMRKIESEN